MLVLKVEPRKNFFNTFSVIVMIYAFFGVLLLLAAFQKMPTEPAEKTDPMLYGGICALASALIVALLSLDQYAGCLEVYSTYFVYKEKGKKIWREELKDVKLEYTDKHCSGSTRGYCRKEYCLTANGEIVQIFDKSYINIGELCDFCMINHVPAIVPATWEDCSKHIGHDLV